MRFSIIIAAHNEGSSLCQTVESSVQSIGGAEPDFEVILASDASWDGSIEEPVARFPQVRVFEHKKRRGASPTKHLGAQNAQGDVLIFLDGHCRPQPGALVRLVEDVEQLDGEALVTPAVPSLDAQRWENSVWQIGHGYHLSLETFDCGWLPLDELKPVKSRKRTFYESPALNGCALAVSRELYGQMRGFDADMLVWGVEDLDFGLRAWLMGHPILHDPEAVIGHRFRSTFDNYEVPYERLLVNQLRMARKSFTHSVWCDWVERTQRRHIGRRSEHPEGLWARAWHLFQEHLATADAERMQIQGRRVRDEFAYAERFGLSWPKLRSMQSGNGTVRLEAVPVDPDAQPSPSPAPGARVILIFGYWPPTDIGIAGNRFYPSPPFPFTSLSGHGMLWDWKDKKSYRGYELMVVSPTFGNPPGWQGDPPVIGPYWGKGDGDLTVDYDVTAKFFWKTAIDRKPCAILSFSRTADKFWHLENYGTNFAHDDWLTAIDYMTTTGPKTGDWFPQPIIGGTDEDPSPNRNTETIPGDPPDNSLAAGNNRNSNLPFDPILDALVEKMADEIDSGDFGPVEQNDGAGNFVSNYMAYLVAWYREWWGEENTDKHKQCFFSGHTHVGAFVAQKIAAKAFKIQLDVVIDQLKLIDK